MLKSAICLFFSSCCSSSSAFLYFPRQYTWPTQQRPLGSFGPVQSGNKQRSLSIALGEYTVTLQKPLGIVLEEREAGKGGVQVASLAEGGAAAKSGAIVRGDTLIKIGNEDVSSADFETVMDILIAAPPHENLSLALSDGLGRMDIAPNLAKTLQAEEAVLADKVVRAAVREIRKNESSRGQLGDLLRVEIVIGAGVRDNGRCMVRFFAIFSRDGVTTFGCSVSATGVSLDGETVKIVALSCAKDEGWGQTIDLILE